MHEVFDGEDVVLAECLLDDRVVGEGDALLVDLAVAALVDQLADGLEVWLATARSKFAQSARKRCAPVCHVWLDETEHLLGGPGHLDKYTVVDLQEAEQLQDLAGFGCNLVDTVELLACER